MRKGASLFAAMLFSVAAVAASRSSLAAEGSLVLLAGRQDGSSYELARELAEALAASPQAPLKLKVEASAGSSANAAKAVARGGAELFICEPGWIEEALRSGKEAPGRGIRVLFPFPFLSLHWVVRAGRGLKSLADLAGERFIAGARGSFTAEETTALLALERPKGAVKTAPVGGENPLAAVADDKAVGFAEAAAFPAPDILALAKRVPIKLLGVPQADLAVLIARSEGLSAMVIPRSTYPGIAADTVTLALPLGVYTTAAMGKAEAYRITAAFWAEKKALSARDPRWAAVSPEALSVLGAKLHQGALEYYSERGLSVLEASPPSVKSAPKPQKGAPPSREEGPRRRKG